MNKIENLIAELKLKLSPVAREQLDELVRSPEAENLFSRETEELRAERAELASRLAGLPKKYAGQHTAAVKQCAADAEAEVAAEDALRLAREKLLASRNVANAAQVHERQERWECEHALRASADPRLQEFADWCQSVADLARGAWSARPVVEGKSWVTGERGGISWATNGDSISAARAALKSAEDDSRGAQLLVLTKQDVSDRLNGHLHNLAPKLEPMRLLNCELNEHGDLVFDRTRKPAELRKDAVLATGFRNDAEPGDAPAPAPMQKVYRGRPTVQHASRQLDQLAN